MKKKFLATILVTIMVISIAGCGVLINDADGSGAEVNGTETNDTQNATESDTEIVAKPNNLAVGMRLGDAIDLTAYNEIVNELISNDDTLVDLKDVLPFDSYIVVPDHGLVNEYEYYYEEDFGVSEHSIISGSILGGRDSVMIVKMNNSDTYAFLIREPYGIGVNFCSFNDLANYKIFAIGLTQQDVENMVLQNNDYIEPEYFEKFMKQYKIASKEIDTLGEYIETQPGTARFFLYDDVGYCGYIELDEFNLATLAEKNLVYVYFGENSVPLPYEDLLPVETDFDYTVEGMFLSDVIEQLMTYAIEDPNASTKMDDGFSSFDVFPPVASQDILDEMLEMGYPADAMDFSYDQWIDASNFPDNMCTDVGLLWLLSIINDEIGGDLLTRGTILNKNELLREMNLTSLPCTDMVGIMNHNTANYCFVVRVHNETWDIERENVTNVFNSFSKYYDTLQDIEHDAEGEAKAGIAPPYAVGPYVMVLCLSDNQGFEDYWEAVSYHSAEHQSLIYRFDCLFNYLRTLSIKNQNNGFSSSDNFWN